jgi:pimeloyl-ACP methyl ester carboxylesterase
MKKKLLGVKRSDILFDYDLYRRNVPIPGVAGQTLSVLDLWPEGAERTILFQHGYAGVLESWEFQINYFASHGYRVIAPDLRGHGQSDAPYSQYTMDELVADMYAITQSWLCRKNLRWSPTPLAARLPSNMPTPTPSSWTNWC